VSALRKVLIGIAVCSMAFAAGASTQPAVNDVTSESASRHYWRRVFDPQHPEAPPRLLSIHGTGALSGSGGKSRQSIVCVRAGEHLVLHQAGTHSSMLSLAATALERGACGDHVRARIQVTGAVAEVTLLKQGIGTWRGRGAKWR
jgi:sarcosine oxidase gamma subunit